MNEKALAYVAAATMILMVVTTMYTIYQAYGVPAVCKNHEARALASFMEDVKALAAAQKTVISTALPAGTPVKMQYAYPNIPFFVTPPYVSVATSLYDITVTLENVASDDVSIPSTITLAGKGARLSFNALYSTPVTAFVELGIIATDGAYVGGSVVDEGSIYLPFFEGDKFGQQLYPLSAGGKGVVIKASDPSQNITLRITGSKIPQSVWRAYASSHNLAISFQGNDIVISLPPDNYLLVSGVTSFGEAPKPSPEYLIARSAVSQRSPAVIDVEAVDGYFNPVKTQITLRCVVSCPVEVCTPSTSGLSCSPLGATQYYTEEASAVVRKSNTGTSVVVASINRPVGGPYEVAFSITSS